MCVELEIDSGYIDTLHTMLAESPAGTVSPGEITGVVASRQRVELALLCSIVAATTFRLHVDLLRALLKALAEKEHLLSIYDRGRYWHLRGFAAWRLDEDWIATCRGFYRSIELLGSLTDQQQRAYLGRTWNSYAQFMHHQGRFHEARFAFERALDYKRDTHDEADRGFTLGNLGRVCLDFGDFDAAFRYLHEDLEIVQRTPATPASVEIQLLSELGQCALKRNDIDSAERYYRRSAELADLQQRTPGQVFSSIGLGRAALASGQIGKACDHLQEARNASASGPVTGPLENELKSIAWFLEAEIHHAAGDYASAISAFEKARDYYECVSTTMPAEIAQLLYRLSGSYLASGDAFQGALLMREALDRIDATGLDARRAEIEERLRKEFPQVWMLHAAGRFIGQEQIDRFLDQAGQSGFRGETQEMTILFSDIRGFTALSESMPPDRLVEVLNDYFTRMTRCIEHFGGVVDKFNGDAIMALFPDSDRQTACCQALQASLLMRAELDFFNLEQEESGVQIECGIGLHAGPVVSGLIGSPQKRSYTVIGDTVNTASRLEGMTRQLGAGILLSEEVKQATGTSRLLLRPLGKFSPKGRKQSVMVYDLLGQDDSSLWTEGLREEVNGCRRYCDYLYSDKVEPAMKALESLADSCGDTEREQGYRFIHRLIGDTVKGNGGKHLREGFALNRK